MLDKIIDFTTYLLTKKRGVMVDVGTNKEAQAALLEHLMHTYEDHEYAIVGKDHMEYGDFVALDAKDMRKVKLWVFLDADSNLRSWDKPATQRLSRMTSRGKKFIFFTNKYDVWSSPKNHAYILAKCEAFKEGAGYIRQRYCNLHAMLNGMLRPTAGVRVEIWDEYKAHIHDNIVDVDILELMFEEENEHSPFGPSGLAQLAKCPGSHYIEEEYERSNGAAMLGTLWHGSAEIHLLNKTRPHPDTPIAPYVDLCLNEMQSGRWWGVEQTFHAKSIHEDLWGTPDFAYIDAEKKELGIIDYKNGAYPVKAEWNTQLIAYAVMIMEHSNFSPERIKFTIMQNGRDPQTWVAEAGRDGMPVFIREHFTMHIKSIINTVIQAEKDPKAFLNHRECYSPFCTARHLHKAVRKKIKEAEDAQYDKREAESAQGKKDKEQSRGANSKQSTNVQLEHRSHICDSASEDEQGHTI